MPKLLVNRRGIGLLELMLSLAIIAILLVMATRYFTQARRGQQIAAAIQQIQGISAAYHSYYLASSGKPASDINFLITNGYLPTGEDTNPWGGPNTVSASSVQPSYANVSLSGLPNTECNMLVTAVKNLVPQGGNPANCAGGTFSGDF